MTAPVARFVGVLFTAVSVSAAASSPDAAPHVPTGPHSYSVRLEPLANPTSGLIGLLATVRINGKSKLRLLVDSGADYVVLTRRAASKAGCVSERKIDLVGAGASSAESVEQIRAATLQAGDLTLENIPLLVTEKPLPDGVDGVMALSIFAGFLVRFDIPGRVIELRPYSAGDADPEGALQARISNQLLFLRGTVNETHPGYFLLDTGAWRSAISRSLSEELHISEALATRVSLQGGLNSVAAPLLTEWVRLRLGSLFEVRGPIVSVDLSVASRYHALDIVGLIGYTSLANSVLTLDYRDSLVRIAAR